MKRITLLLLFVSVVSVNGKVAISSLPSRTVRKSSHKIDRVNLDNSHQILASKGTDNESSSFLEKIKGPACILGGALAHLTFGTSYCWGNFLSYAPDYLKFFDSSRFNAQGIPPDALYVLPFTITAQAIAMPFGPSIVEILGPSKTLLLGSWIVALATYFASYQKSLASFILVYSILFGAGAGLAYTAPMIAGWKLMPDAKGLVSGGILGGFGAGGFIFSLVGRHFVNPGKLEQTNGRFPDSVYENFPSMLRKLSVIYAIVASIGAMMITDTKPKLQAADATTKSEPTTTPGVSLHGALRTHQFWLVWAMIICSATAGLNTASIYKQFASTSPVLYGDGYQSSVGGIGALCNGIGRLLWGIISDKMGFKNSFSVLTVLQMVLMLTYQHSVHSKTLFAANTWLLFFCLAGNFALMPSATQRLFGPKAGTVIYGVIFSAFAIASILGGYMTKAVVKSFGYETVFKIMAAMSIIATLIVSKLTPITEYSVSSV